MNNLNDIKLNGQSWSLEFVSIKDMPKKTWGDCNDKKKLMRVRKDLSDQNLLDTMIHELLHAAAYTMFSEEWVEETASEIAKTICRSGMFNRDD